jgi:hypothetical protein
MKKSKPKNPAAVALGRKGGRATKKKYSSKQLAEWGSMGGRGNRKPNPLKKGGSK